jgi:hypothetical protein
MNLAQYQGRSVMCRDITWNLKTIPQYRTNACSPGEVPGFVALLVEPNGQSVRYEYQLFAYRIMIPGIDGSEQNAINRLYWVELRCKLKVQGYRIPRDRLRILGSSL